MSLRSTMHNTCTHHTGITFGLPAHQAAEIAAENATIEQSQQQATPAAWKHISMQTCLGTAHMKWSAFHTTGSYC